MVKVKARKAGRVKEEKEILTMASADNIEGI